MSTSKHHHHLKKLAACRGTLCWWMFDPTEVRFQTVSGKTLFGTFFGQIDCVAWLFVSRSLYAGFKEGCVNWLSNLQAGTFWGLIATNHVKSPRTTNTYYMVCLGYCHCVRLRLTHMISTIQGTQSLEWHVPYLYHNSTVCMLVKSQSSIEVAFTMNGSKSMPVSALVIGSNDAYKRQCHDGGYAIT